MSTPVPRKRAIKSPSTTSSSTPDDDNAAAGAAAAAAVAKKTKDEQINIAGAIALVVVLASMLAYVGFALYPRGGGNDASLSSSSSSSPLSLSLSSSSSSSESSTEEQHPGHWTVKDIPDINFEKTVPPVPAGDVMLVEPNTGVQFKQWDPVSVGHVRRIMLDNSGKIYNMTTMAMDTPIFVIDEFLTDEECARVKELAYEAGLFKSDHTFLDGSNLKDRHMDTKQLSIDETNALFRYSDQTWLPPSNDRLLASLVQRAVRLAQLPARTSVESLQVVKYGLEGHYESHYDSEADDKGPCCIDPVARGFRTGVEALGRPLSERCRLCRAMTILYFLEDTTSGGGTVFPLADMTDEELKNWEKFPSYRQTRDCEPGLVVTPKKRRAVMWYNHKLDRGYLGALNPRSLHGGCNVKEGVKWISNHWISTIPHPDVKRTPARSHQ